MKLSDHVAKITLAKLLQMQLLKVMDIKTSAMSKAAENLELCPDHIVLWSALLRGL